MTKYIIAVLLCCASIWSYGQSQDSGQPAPDRQIKYKTPLEEDLAKKDAEIDYFSKHLDMLKSAYQSADASNIVLHESTLQNTMRIIVDVLKDKVDGDKVQRDRRKSASSGVPSAAGASERPKRDPLADPETPSEKRLESMQYILAAFKRHAFDPAKPADATRDFAKLDQFLQLMKEEVADLRKIQTGGH